ncbi:flavin reductase family protein [Micromonospora sp. NPDC051227]|uniref:flavin reductase family protein n=1 Tax=Micromonospora sp. NPDC051227 TaxID=3364285 RepID=UPI0037929FB4
MSVDSARTAPAGVIDPDTLRCAFGAFATGVTVVTVGSTAPHGMTANSFTTVSLDPALVLVCVDRRAIMHTCLVEAEYFGVSVLAADQEDVARYFADRRRPMGSAQFDAVPCLTGRHTGVPLIAGAAAHFECRLWRSYDGGDHTIFLGHLVSLERSADADALLFLSGRFRQIGRERSGAA